MCLFAQTNAPKTAGTMTLKGREKQIETLFSHIVYRFC